MKTRILSAIRDLEKHLTSLESRGVRFIAREEAREISQPAPAGDAGRARSLEEVQNRVTLCTRCPLFETRRNTVFGEGSPFADLVFVGEAPGADEDEQGRPFVGAAGKLLTKIIESIGLKREKVYICNILKCRPPQNRTPLPAEIAECRDYVLRQLEIIHPRIICTLGSVATQALLNTTEGITKLRGRVFDFRGIMLIPTYHPAYLLRNELSKRETWEDMKRIKKELGL